MYFLTHPLKNLTFQGTGKKNGSKAAFSGGPTKSKKEKKN